MSVSEQYRSIPGDGQNELSRCAQSAQRLVAVSVTPENGFVIPAVRSLLGPAAHRWMWGAIARAIPRFRSPITSLEKTPLPERTRVLAPPSGVSPEQARFTGIWNGSWRTLTGRPALPHTLLVERIHPFGVADVVHSYGTAPGWGRSEPGWYRATARIAHDLLFFRVELASGYAVYRWEAGRLRAALGGKGFALLSRIDDLDAVRCTDAVHAVTPPGPTRDELTVACLLADDPAPVLVHNDCFAPVGEPGPAAHALAGILTIGPVVLRNAHRGCFGSGVALPELSFSVFADREDLVFAERDTIRIPTRDRLDQIILSPGRVWSEAADGGYSRASFSFVLGSSLANEAHNGLATFVYTDAGVSSVRLQITQQTNPWRKVDLWGQATAHYVRLNDANGEALLSVRRAERQAYLPITRLDADARVTVSADADDGFGPSITGYLVDDLLVVQPGSTITGEFPYPQEMRHGAFSVSKSLGGALVLFWLAGKFGDEVLRAPVAQYLRARPARLRGWENVTFGDLLDMASGRGDRFPDRTPNRPFADESGPRMRAWSRARSTARKLDVALGFARYPWPPGTVFRYNTAQLFVLACAMEALLREREGPTARLWERFTAEVLNPVGIVALPMMHSEERDGSRGVPLLGTGAYPTLQEAAKLVRLLARRGRHGDRQLLSATAIDQALDWQQDNGLATAPDFDRATGTYKFSFWRQPHVARDGAVITVCFMAGYGGSIVAMLPNSTACIRFSDDQDYDLHEIVRVAERLRPLQSNVPGRRARTVPVGERLDADTLAQAIVGNTLLGADWLGYCDPSGRLYASAPAGIAVGSWSVGDDGTLSRSASPWKRGAPERFTVYRQAQALVLVNQADDARQRIEVKAGPPRGLE